MTPGHHRRLGRHAVVEHDGHGPTSCDPHDRRYYRVVRLQARRTGSAKIRQQAARRHGLAKRMPRKKSGNNIVAGRNPVSVEACGAHMSNLRRRDDHPEMVRFSRRLASEFVVGPVTTSGGSVGSTVTRGVRPVCRLPESPEYGAIGLRAVEIGDEGAWRRLEGHAGGGQALAPPRKPGDAPPGGRTAT